MSIPTHKTFSESQKVYIPPKWHRDKLGGKSPSVEETGYRDFKVNAVDVAIEKEMILREFNRRKEGGGSHVTNHVTSSRDLDIPVLKPGQVEGGQGDQRGGSDSINNNGLDRFVHGNHGNGNPGNAHHQPDSFPEYQLPRQSYPVEDLGIPLADDGSDVEYEEYEECGRSSGYDSGRYSGYDSGRYSGYDHGHEGGHGGHTIVPRGVNQGGYSSYDTGYDHPEYSDHVTRHAPMSDHVTRHAPVSDQSFDVGQVSRHYSKSPTPDHVRDGMRSPIPDHVRDDVGVLRSPVSGHVNGYGYPGSSAVESRTMSPAPARSMSRSPNPGHVSMSRSPNPGHVSMSRSPATSHVSTSRSPNPGHVDRAMSRSPQPVYDDYRSHSPNPVDDLGYRSVSPNPADYRSHSPNPSHVNHRSVSPNPSHVNHRSIPPIDTSFDLSSDDDFSPASPSFRPPLSPNLALSSDDEDVMTIGEIKSAMAREEAARMTVGELRGGYGSGRFGHVSSQQGSRSGHVSRSNGSSRTGTPETTVPGGHSGSDSRFGNESRTLGSISSTTNTSSRSSTPVSASTPTSRANRTWANTSRFSLADSERQDRDYSDSVYSSRERLDSSTERLNSSSSRLNNSSSGLNNSSSRLNSSNYHLNNSHNSSSSLNNSHLNSNLGSSTSSISTFGYDSVGSNVSRDSFRYDMCSARPGSRVSCYDDDFGNVTVETVREEPDRSFEVDRSRDHRQDSRDHVQNRISRDFGNSRNDILDNPSICLPTGDPHKSREGSRDDSNHDSTHVKTLPQHVTPCAPPQPSYMSRSVASTRPRCIVCDDHVAMNERIVQTESVSGSRDIYHLRCFRCCICDSSLEHMEHYIDPHSDMLFCHVDYHETFSPKCAQCSSCIEGDYVQALGKTYHVDHFFCAQCGKPFQEGSQHHIIEGHAYCSPCHDVKTAEKCWRCNHVFNVNDPIIEVLDRLWCETCYSCEECGVGLKEEFTLTNEGVVLCERCQVKEVKRYAWQ